LKNIIKGIRRHYCVSEQSIEQLSEHLNAHYFSKNHLLTRAGVKDHSVYFIEKGCTRTFFLIDGKEVTNWFSEEGDITFSSNSLYHAAAGNDYVEVLEDSLIYSISIDKLNTLYSTNLEIANWSRVLHQEVLLKMQNLRIDRLSLSAKDRYEKFFSENATLFNRVNLGHISSYLGMTQQHLSSLRADIRF